MPVTTITTDAPVITLANVFIVDPSRQRELMDVLVTVSEEVMRKLPGFVTANIHASTDGTRVLNYAQWATEADFQAMLAHPEAGRHMAEAAKIAESFDPHIYTVDAVHHRAEQPTG
ncbi:MAG TPA: antibiotic biosynthesis monooxygenase [Pseudonocardiaceae bacterium]|jgi:heme-degrading monooxygenase HmoA|nr:antibiotic biosynthesis monooxygenase [Pseudonocardiaceae bacterium]